MAELGLNADGRGAIAPSSLAALGARWVRAPAYPEVDLTAWIHECRDHGLKVLLVLARESIGDDTEQRLAMFARRYNGVVNAVQIANEPDHVSPSSWTMAPNDLNRLLRTARAVFGPSKLLIGPGLVSGQPGWAGQIDWSPVDAICFHPYAKDAYTAELDALIDGYEYYGLPLWVTEYHARSLGMAAYLRDDPRIGVALAFCYTDRMVPGFGLIEDYRALNDFVQATGGPLNPPPPDPGGTMPSYQLGIAEKVKALRAAGYDPGKALEDETYPYENSPYSYQMAERGLFVYSKAARKVVFLESR